jgi:hypothetical protein
MKEDFNQLLNTVQPMIMKHYEECGRPKTTKMNKFAFPPEILKELGPIND